MARLLLSLSFLLVVISIASLISRSLYSNVFMSSQITGPNIFLPVSVHLCPHTTLKKDQTSRPIKKEEEEEKGKVMAEDEHGEQWHLTVCLWSEQFYLPSAPV